MKGVFRSVARRTSLTVGRPTSGEQVNALVDWENVAEEIDSVGTAQRIALAGHVRVVLEHLMKLEASPAVGPRCGWEEAVRRARLDIKRLLEDSPSLRRTADAAIARQLPDVREIVALVLARYGETPRVAVEALSYDADAVLGRFFPATQPKV